jgi:hypothetical protein
MMALFGKKKGNVPEAPMDMGAMSQNPLVGMVIGMRQQGMSNNQIIQDLQRQGYNPQQIFDAINMAEPTNIPAGPLQGNSFPTQQPLQQDFAMPSDPGSMMQQPIGFSSGGDLSKEKLEEMAEAIIDEKWEELVKSINKIIEWKGKIEGNISKIEQEMKDLKDMFNQVHSSLIGKIGEYDKNIMSVGTEVKAMSQVFEKILPTFTENVSELRRIVKSTKQ